MRRCAKVRYRKQSDAVSALISGKRRGLTLDHTYYCQPCRAWHVTSGPKSWPLSEVK